MTGAIQNAVIKRMSLVDQALDLIHIAIFDGELSPGTRISLSDLSRRFGISSTPLREAIRKAESEGLIESIPGKGFVVRTIDRKEVDDIYEVRLLLEPLAASIGCKFITESEIVKVEQAQQQIKNMLIECVNKKIERLCLSYRREFHDFNLKFHFTIYNASKNKILTELIRLLWSRSVLIVGSTLTTVKRLKEVVEEHEKILDALKIRNCEKIKDAAKHHLLMTKAKALSWEQKNLHKKNL